ncbi:hypothetical protein Tco_1026488 [Tanacetum coccineum]
MKGYSKTINVGLETHKAQPLVVRTQNRENDRKLQRNEVAYKVFDETPKKNFRVFHKVFDETSKDNVISRTTEFKPKMIHEECCLAKPHECTLKKHPKEPNKRVLPNEEYLQEFNDGVNLNAINTESKECLQTDTLTLSQPEGLLKQELCMDGKLVLE